MGDHRGNTPNIHNASFEEIKKCQGEWLNDSKIGLNLTYEFIWLNSKIANEIKNGKFEEAEKLKAQINLIDNIFDDIFINCYKTRNSYMFPIDVHYKLPENVVESNRTLCGYSGMDMAHEIRNKVKYLKQLYLEKKGYLECLDIAKMFNDIEGIRDPKQLCNRKFGLQTCNEISNQRHFHSPVWLKISSKN